MRFDTTQQPRPAPSCAGGFIYVVRRGDTMYSIAQRHGVTLQEMIDANPQIPDPSRLYIGDQLCVPRHRRIGPECPGFVYTVQPGDSLWELAQRYGTTVDEILQLNSQITTPDQIDVGDRICIPGRRYQYR